MRIVNLDPTSEEGQEFRADKITGTKLHKVYPKKDPTKELVCLKLSQAGTEFNPKAPANELLKLLTPHQLAELKATQDEKDEFYKLVAGMVARPVTFNDYEAPEGVKVGWRERGHILEPFAVEAFKERSGLDVVQTDQEIWVSDDNPNITVSPDGYINGKAITEAIEVKCPDNHVVIRAYNENRYPEKYHEQVLQYFIVNDKLQKLYFLIYTDCIPSLPLQVFEVRRKDVANQLIEYKAFQEIIIKNAKELAAKLAF